jgi:hypothetical protein
MGNQEPYSGDPSFVPKPARAAWANWLIVAAILGGCAVLLLFTPSPGIALVVAAVGTLVCLIGAAVSALMRR